MTSQDPNDRREEGSRPAPESEQPTVQSPAPRRLYRARQDRVIRGVAGGLGHYFDVDPIIFRIAFVCLTFFGGAGIFLYLAFWLFVPTEGEAGAGPRPPSRAVTVIGVVVLVIAAIALLDPWGPNDGGWGWGWWWGGFLFPTVLIAIVGVLLWRYFEGRRQGGGRAGMARAESAEGTTTTVSATSSESTGSGMNATWLAGRIALVVAIMAGATFLFFGSAIAAAAGGGVAVAAIVVAIGAMLIVAAFNGGARWLIVPALLMAFPVGVVSAADVRLDGGVGEREYHPTTVTDVRDHYELGMGRLEIDLREAKLPKGDTALDLDLGVGGAAVVVPRDVCVALDAKVGAGYARLLDRDSAGLDVDWSVQPEAPRGVPRLLIDAEVGMGAVQVIHDPGDLDEIDSGGGNDACVRAP
jgi:phage shock protein PspC (stress-responsive transcriptional regulator)/predicted membrane protein